MFSRDLKDRSGIVKTLKRQSSYSYGRFIELCFLISKSANHMDKAGSLPLDNPIFRGRCMPNVALNVGICKRSAQARRMEARRAKTPAHAGGLVHDSPPARARTSEADRAI